MDPRLTIIAHRLENVGRLIAVSGGKGGIGKSSTASILSLSLAKMSYRVGLLDLDFYGPSCHLILGIKGVYPEEEKGVIPPEVNGIRFMSIVYYAKDNPLMARGIDISNSIIELLAITRWGELDFLIIDMPPGIGDTTLDVIRLLKRIEFLVVTTPSMLALETVKKTLEMLKEAKVPIIGVIENMKVKDSPWIRNEIEKLDVRFLGKIDYDTSLEDCVGDREKLLASPFARDINKIFPKLDLI
ncbi:ATP-binding protein [candidate division WOR-3 bacterium JGI_Cruoil_03_44_89]|uniref:Iron-sulfur cluster carrier protein n=1 Tax=candidate division WOR-3 bacterium JGI_Cruoil_03_44_89 TaxID=1973748 RepID=A0A235BR07_UNCW3|nr:MAG: ATP-binding protein [candidate division WOR-3 bacterium JGI_Cruoil_03_44_89]